MSDMFLQGQEQGEYDDNPPGPEANTNEAMSGPVRANRTMGRLTPGDAHLVQAVGWKHGPEILNLRNGMERTKSRLQAKQLAYLSKSAEAIKAHNYDPVRAGIVLGHMAGDPELAGHVNQIRAMVRQNPQALKPIVDHVHAFANGGGGQHENTGGGNTGVDLQKARLPHRGPVAQNVTQAQNPVAAQASQRNGRTPIPLGQAPPPPKPPVDWAVNYNGQQVGDPRVRDALGKISEQLYGG